MRRKPRELSPATTLPLACGLSLPVLLFALLASSDLTPQEVAEMKRALLMGFALAAGCATPHVAENPSNQSERIEARCRLLGTLASKARHNPRAGILDERRTTGPSRVIWMTPANSSHVVTPDGNLYLCDRRL